MIFLLSLILLFMLLTYLSFIKPLNVSFNLNSDTSNWHASANWLSSLLRIVVKPDGSKVKISVYILNIKCLSKALSELSKKRKKPAIAYLKAISIQDERVEIFHGLNESHLTGLICGGISAFGSLFGLSGLQQYPDFVSTRDYIQISADIKINLGKTLMNIAKLKSSK